MADGYHHGNLRAALLNRTGEVIARDGVAAVSLRALAADVGVSHTAPRHHFGSRDGLLTAYAAQGYDLLAGALGAVRERGGSFVDVGVAYVRFASEHRAHFAVMFDADVLIAEDAGLVAAQGRAMDEIRRGVDALGDPAAKADMAAATIAGWSMMHGLAVLDGTGALDLAHVRDLVDGGDLLAIAHRAAGMLYGSPESHR
jgi:AcrR family transcriptional regulator